MTPYLYRKFPRQAIAAVLAVFLTFTYAAAQDRSQSRSNQGSAAKKAKRGPRAIAVVEFLPGGGMRLVPIALWIDGRYYDASLYAANPLPMALEPQTVYEAQSLGEPTGTFTITQPRQVNGAWVADGTWRPHLAMDDRLAAHAAKDAANKPKGSSDKSVFSAGSDDSRPVLKRAPNSGGDSGSSNQTHQSTTPPDPDRPVMKRPAGESSSNPPSTSSGGSTSTAPSPVLVDDHDPDRPVMKRVPAASVPAANAGAGASPALTAAAASSNDNDPNRPVLSRSKTPKKQATADVISAANDVPFTANMKGGRAYPAISDAGDYRGRPLLYNMSPGQRKAQEEQVLKLALDEIRAFASKRNGPPIPKTATITDYEARAFDLDFSSSPTIVLTAKLPVAGGKGQPANFEYFISLVAKIDINDQAQKIFSSVTDTRHLDAYPRMELIDAVDADANGRGDLLFRQYSDTGITYGLYRVTPYQIEKIFEGGSGL
jgi:hypothetical protein